MKRTITALLSGVGLAGFAFGGSATINITAPQVTSWTQGGVTLTGSNLTQINNDLVSEFATVQNDLNNGYISKLHDLTQLSQGFANANMAAFDNASLLGYQTYDTFALSIGSNVGLAVPSLNPGSAASTINDITTNGDEYAGLATGGFAGQFGLNLSFLVPQLYATVKAGFVPTVTVNGASYQQLMVGVGVNYTLLKQADFLFGFFKWRGVSVGTGLTYNANTTNVTINIPDQTSQSFQERIGSQTDTLTAAATNVKTTLTVTDSSVVIPIDLMTSIQALWFLNFGLGVGADLSFSSANVKLGGSSNLTVNGLTGATMTPGSATLTATDSNGTGAVLVPRLAASLGLDLTIFKLDVPVSFYPTTKAFAAGVTLGIVW